MTKAALAALAALSLGACTAGYLSSAPEPSGGTSTFRERMSSLFFGSSSPSAQQVAAPPGADPSDDCPGVALRQGASTLQFATPGAEPTAVNLRYQASIARMARECSVRGPAMTVKVGVLGRIILGPAGTPGQIEIPFRIALVREGVQPKTVWTKFYKFPVTMAPGQNNVPFLHVEEDLTFPIPGRAELDAYLIYVGFDQQTPPERPVRKKKKRRSG